MTTSFPEPHLLEFPRIGATSEGYISVAEHQKALPFAPQRTFWTYYTPESVVRGRHAHHRTEQVLIAAAGRIIVTCETKASGIQTFLLDQPQMAVYVPPHAWHTMQYSHSSVQLVFASTPYQPEDYIRDYEQFREVWMK